MTRSGCHLCDEAVADLEKYRSAGGAGGGALEIEQRNIESDEDLHRRFMERIPVIMIGEEIISEFAFDADAFEAALGRLSQGAG